jgi:hypothetical protein
MDTVGWVSSEELEGRQCEIFLVLRQDGQCQHRVIGKIIYPTDSFEGRLKIKSAVMRVLDAL